MRSSFLTCLRTFSSHSCPNSLPSRLIVIMPPAEEWLIRYGKNGLLKSAVGFWNQKVSPELSLPDSHSSEAFPPDSPAWENALTFDCTRLSLRPLNAAEL